MKTKWLHRICEQGDGRDWTDGEEPNYAIPEVSSTTQNEPGSLGILVGNDPLRPRASLLPIPVLDFFLDGIRAHVIRLDLEDFAIG
jgi:hypothetical protein